MGQKRVEKQKLAWGKLTQTWEGAAPAFLRT